MKSESWKKKKIRAQIRMSADRAVDRPIPSTDRSVDRTQLRVGHASRSIVPVDRSPCYIRPGSRPSCACARACRSTGRSTGHCSGLQFAAFSFLLDSVVCAISFNELKTSSVKLLSPLSLQFLLMKCLRGDWGVGGCLTSPFYLKRRTIWKSPQFILTKSTSIN